MSKKDYIDAVNEIEVREDLKKEMLNKMKENKKKSGYNKVYPIASLVLMAAIVVGVMLIPRDAITNQIKNDPVAVTEESPLEKVGDFDNLYAMLKEKTKDSNYYRYKEVFLTDDVAINEATATEKSINSTASVSDDYSKTNVQVEGVDEADIVKTDGKFIYYLTREGLTITYANDLKLVNTIKFDKNFNSREIFVKNNKIIIIGTNFRETEPRTYERNSYKENTNFATAYVYNIDNKENPKLERTIELEGNYLNSRMIGDNVYLLSNKYIYSYICQDYKIEELNKSYFKPSYIDSAISDKLQYKDFDSIYCIPEFDETSYLNIASFNVKNEEPAQIESYLGVGNTIYASEKNLYVTIAKYDYKEIIDKYDEDTEIYKFTLDNGKCTFSKSGKVSGTILNQFSMDEKDGYFRIATTDNSYWISDKSDNNLYVLDENLEVVGCVENLAKGERIYSVRFMGDRAYIVTFVQTDPLFVIDLSTPTNPTVIGELKIPGYSTYLHPYDETHIIGFGQNTDVVNYGYGDVVTTAGMKMALFDVTDPENPKEMYKVDIGEKGTYSELLSNHKALLFSKEKNIIAFPISVTGENYKVTFQGAIVYSLSLEKGFEEKGKITHYDKEIDKYYYGNGVQRIIYINDTLYTLSQNLIKATDISTMQETGSVEID